MSASRIAALEARVKKLEKFQKRASLKLYPSGDHSEDGSKSGSESELPYLPEMTESQSGIILPEAHDRWIVETPKPPDPPAQSVPVVLEAVNAALSTIYPMLIQWIQSKDNDGNRRFGARFFKLINQRNVRQALFERDRKAKKKYGRGLSTMDQIGTQDSVEKMGDVVFMLYKMVENYKQSNEKRSIKEQEAFNTLLDLNTTVQFLLTELKQAAP